MSTGTGGSESSRDQASEGTLWKKEICRRRKFVEARAVGINVEELGEAGSGEMKCIRNMRKRQEKLDTALSTSGGDVFRRFRDNHYNALISCNSRNFSIMPQSTVDSLCVIFDLMNMNRISLHSQVMPMPKIVAVEDLDVILQLIISACSNKERNPRENRKKMCHV